MRHGRDHAEGAFGMRRAHAVTLSQRRQHVVHIGNPDELPAIYLARSLKVKG
jgi:hypothetical protein